MKVVMKVRSKYKKMIGILLCLSLIGCFGRMDQTKEPEVGSVGEPVSLSQWQFCANEDGFCQISSNYNIAVIRYGGVDNNMSHWSYRIVEFASNASNRGIPCSNYYIESVFPPVVSRNFGDSFYGLSKTCSIGKLDAFPLNGVTWTQCATEDQNCTVAPVPSGSSLRWARFGQANPDRFYYRLVDQTFTCSNSFFGGDPAYGLAKVCSVSDQPAYTSDDWTFCGNEGGTCDLGVNDVSVVVRYGVPGSWTYAHVSGNGIACDNNMFMDPAPDQQKECQVLASTEETFANPSGQWNLAASCNSPVPNQCKIQVTLLEGVTSTTSNTVSDQWSTKLATTIKSGFEFFGPKGEVSITAETAQSVTKTISDSLSKTVSKSCSATCDNQRLYQYTMSVDEGCTESSDEVCPFDIYTCQFACLPASAGSPQCPPGSVCNDANCSQCIPE